MQHNFTATRPEAFARFLQQRLRWLKLRRMVLSILLLMGLGYSLISWAQTSAVENFLADRHAERGIVCAQCHVEDPPAKEVTSEKCLTCHISYESLAEKTKMLEHNPHESHLGEIECSDCHKAHAPPKLVCNDCHAFDMKVP